MRERAFAHAGPGRATLSQIYSIVNETMDYPAGTPTMLAEGFPLESAADQLPISQFKFRVYRKFWDSLKHSTAIAWTSPWQ
jgi:hypothetical protein